MSNYSDSNFTHDKNSSWYKIYRIITPGSKVLDVGCSSGNFGKVLIDKKHCTVHGIEIDKNDFEAAQKQLHKVFRLNIESDKLDALDTDYDFVYFGDVIEHLVTPGRSLHRVVGLLKDSGRLLFSVPNMTHLLVRLMLLQGKFEYGETGLLDKTHLHYYDYNFLQDSLNQAGFEVDVIDPVKKDLPEEVVQKELSRVGLKNTPEFMQFMRTTHASFYQFVGSAKKAPEGRPAKKKALVVSSPVDIFQTYLDDTVRYYKDQIKILQKQVNEHGEQSKELRKDNRKLSETLASIYASSSWRATKPLRTASRLLKHAGKQDKK